MEEELFIVHVPALVAVLLNAEKHREHPLTEAEVLEIRDAADAIAMPLPAKIAVAEERGYDDIDPENAWAEWTAIRPSLYEGEESR